jgi:phage baseplate assembly protein W
MAKIFYHGFSSDNWIESGHFGVTNMEVIKADLMNHLMTAKGDRVMMPDWGTRIPLMLFEPNDETSRRIIEEDIRYVINYDPRIRLIDMQVVSLPDNNAVLALIDVLYVEFNVTDTLRIEVKTG